jgi:tetratricopeptide (TPR) repeat protein
VLADDRVIEALRWIGDGNARLLGERAGKEPSAELAGMIAGLRALAIVAASPYGDVTDWVSFASFAAALGRPAEAVAIARAGAQRFPTAPELRQGLNDALWRAGRIDLAPVAADWLRDQAPSATADWFAGYAWMLAAEDDRRSENHDGAIAAYETAASRFAAAAAQQRDLEAECRRFAAMTWFGRGMAHVRVGRAAAAADCLVRAVGDNAELPKARDGLDCDVRDLVDRVLEWRESGPSPVAPLPLLDRLAAIAPTDPFWANAISDSELREALRADGRNPQRAERDTVDAGGKPIRMLMGLPTAEGDDYLRAAIAAGRRAMPHAANDDDRVPLAQADTIWAERMLERNRTDDVASVLAEAAALLRIAPPPPEADVDQLGRVVAQLRRQLGEARPRFRPGR